MIDHPIKTITFEERARWGTCPVCCSGQNEACEISHEKDEDAMFHTVHTKRIQAAPRQVRLVPVEGGE